MSNQPNCECCHSPLGKPIDYLGTSRVICAGCLGFIARWWMDIQGAQNTPRTEQPLLLPIEVTVGDHPPCRQ